MRLSIRIVNNQRGIMMEIKLIPDGNSNFELVKLNKNFDSDRLTPHCKIHGAMNKVSDKGIWRCLRSHTEIDCRAGCIEAEE